MKKYIAILLTIIVLFSSCAHSKYVMVDNQPTLARPYGWVNKKSQKNDDVKYELSAGSIIFSVIFIETLIVPVWLTGWKLYTPTDGKKVKSKEEAK